MSDSFSDFDPHCQFSSFFRLFRLIRCRIGKKFALRIDSARIDGRDYPDNGSSAEVYTNPNPLTYVELERLGPLAVMKVGDKRSATNKYTLLRHDARTQLPSASDK